MITSPTCSSLRSEDRLLMAPTVIELLSLQAYLQFFDLRSPNRIVTIAILGALPPNEPGQVRSCVHFV